MKTSFPADALVDSAKTYGQPRIFRQSCRMTIGTVVRNSRTGGRKIVQLKTQAKHKFLPVLDREKLCAKLERLSR